GKKVTFIYRPLPAEMNLSDNGLLTGPMASADIIYDLSFRVTDQSGLSDAKTLQFTSAPYLHFTVDGEDYVNYGDTIGLDLRIRNGGEVPLLYTSLVLSTIDPFIQLTEATCQPGSIMPGQVMVIPDAFHFIVSTDIPDQHDILLDCALSASDKDWHKELIFKAYAPVLKLQPVTVEDNENGRLDPGETAPILVTFQNAGHAAIDGVNAELFPLDPEVLIIGSPIQDFGTIGKSASVARSYFLNVGDSAPEGMTVHLLLITETLQGLQRQDTISLRIGRTPVLVIDMDPNYHSGPSIYSQLVELNVFADYEYTITDHISEYQSLFISLGYHNSNHVLTLGEGTQLAAYLENGGKIYMEGKKTWRDDPYTPIQPMFNIGHDGTVTIYDTITGVDGTFTEGTRLFNGTLYSLNFYHMVPIPPAFTILQDNNLLLPCAVAYDAGTYKTIGSLFDFGTLEDLNPSLKSDLMISYLNFFDIYMNPIGIEEQGGMGAWEPGGLEVWPNPASRQLTVGSWQLAVGQGSAVRITITDLLGKTVREYENVSSFPYIIDVSSLHSGIYILRMCSEEGIIGSAKFIKIED
ncbi:MAG: T9SS type A sorting domain-containing protein, partial [Bacteroidales bacterium]|nr:T9SS type A sorting domain-containing protein [Bacteroidales bacterium]